MKSLTVLKAPIDEVLLEVSKNNSTREINTINLLKDETISNYVSNILRKSLKKLRMPNPINLITNSKINIYVKIRLILTKISSFSSIISCKLKIIVLINTMKSIIKIFYLK